MEDRVMYEAQMQEHEQDLYKYNYLLVSGLQFW